MCVSCAFCKIKLLCRVGRPSAYNVSCHFLTEFSFDVCNYNCQTSEICDTLSCFFSHSSSSTFLVSSLWKKTFFIFFFSSNLMSRQQHLPCLSLSLSISRRRGYFRNGARNRNGEREREREIQSKSRFARTNIGHSLHFSRTEPGTAIVS
jgi:hypothetical protein